METKMWEVLPNKDKEEYKKMILAFASLSEMFTQKAIGLNEVVTPIVNSKFQETVFQKAFHANAEDIGNTSYDVSLKVNVDGQDYKYLIGIKTFGFTSGDQKVAQFKAYQPNYLRFIEAIEKNTRDKELEKEEIKNININNYLEIAKRISIVRNKRIDSSIENLKGFKVEDNEEVFSVYHVLMPSKQDEKPRIFVGETNYDKIDIDNITILGCTNKNNPTNFSFTDGKHIYKYTSSDSQLYMKFNNDTIVVDTWDVKYAEDAYSIFSSISKEVYQNEFSKKDVNVANIESFSWSLLGRNGEVELFSGLNSFFAVGSKLSKDSRKKRCDSLYEKYHNEVDINILNHIYEELLEYLLVSAPTFDEKMDKAVKRNKLRIEVNETKNIELIKDVTKLLYRPMNEVYIPIPNSKKFHIEHSDFFGNHIGKMEKDINGKEIYTLCSDKDNRRFNLIFEPSGDTICSFIAQDSGKAIESFEKQSYLGEWILRKVFQLREYQPLTTNKLNEIGINGVRLYKEKGSKDIHIQFIWIDENNLPSDYFE